MSRIYVYVWRDSGLLGHSTTPHLPAGTLQLTVVHSQSALKRILAHASLGHGESRFVPGMPTGGDNRIMGTLANFVDIAIHRPKRLRRRSGNAALHEAELSAKGMAEAFSVLAGRQLDYFDRVENELVEEEVSLLEDDDEDDEDPDYEPDYSERFEENEEDEDHEELEDELEYDD